jgi:hypothetical protein
MKDKLVKKMRRLISNKRGVNAIISSILLCSAVITLGFAVFAYAQHQASDANMRYADNTNNNIARIQEKLVFEHIYNNCSLNELTVFIINCGNSDDVGLAKAYLTRDSLVQSFEDIELKSLNGTIIESLDFNEEAFFKLSINLAEDASYTLQILTTRGRFFVTTFTA